MDPEKADYDGLLSQAENGDSSARQRLLELHRDRLCRMVAVRLDPRLAARVDPSDVVQEALTEAAQKLPAYLKNRPLPFYPWLRQLAWERLLKFHEKHLQAGKRSVLREQRLPPELSDESAAQLAGQLVDSKSSPIFHAMKEEMQGRVRQALERLPESDRDILVLRYLEQLTTGEIANILEISEGAVKMRHRRALNRLCRKLGPDFEEQHR